MSIGMTPPTTSFYPSCLPNYGPENQQVVMLSERLRRLEEASLLGKMPSPLSPEASFYKQQVNNFLPLVQGLRTEIGDLKRASESSIGCSIFRCICIVITILALATLVVLALAAFGVCPGIQCMIMTSAVGLAFGVNTFVALSSISAGVALLGGIGILVSGKKPRCC